MLIHSKNVDEYQKIKNAGINFEEIYEDYVYNIEVEDYHTYFVGDAGIWVHNTDSCFTELVTVNPKVTKAGDITTVNVKTGNSSDYQEFINNLDLSSGCSR